jgi:signal peptidase II
MQKKHLALLLIILAALDIVTKALTHRFLPLQTGYEIVIFKNFLGVNFSLCHTINTGAAWGAFSNWQLPLFFLRCGLALGLLTYLLFFKATPATITPLSFILVGAVCNLIDTPLYGHVIDMFHFVLWGYDYPVFNVADSLIFLGVARLVYLSLFKKEEARA